MLGILDIIATRFEAAKTEISAAQGRVWKNRIWDLAARKIRMKRSRIEKWWLMIESAGGEGRYRIVDEVGGDVAVGDGAELGDLGGNEGAVWYDVRFGGGLQDDWLWATDLFGGIDGSVGNSFEMPPVLS